MRRSFLIVVLSIFIVCSICYGIEVVRVASMTYSVKSTALTIAGTAVALPTTALAGRESIAIRNNTVATEVLYIGGSDVTTANGFPLDTYTPATSLDIDDSVIIYGISDGSNIDARVLEAK